MPKMTDIACVADLEESERLLSACIDALTAAEQEDDLIMARIQTRPDKYSGTETAAIINNIDPAVIEDPMTLRRKLFDKISEEPGIDYTGSIMVRFERVGNLKDCLRSFSCTIKDETAEAIMRGTNPQLLDGEANRWIKSYDALTAILTAGAGMMQQNALVVQHLASIVTAGDEPGDGTNTFQGEALNMLRQIGSAIVGGDVGLEADMAAAQAEAEAQAQAQAQEQPQLVQGEPAEGEQVAAEPPAIDAEAAEKWARANPAEAKAMAKKLYAEGIISLP